MKLFLEGPSGIGKSTAILTAAVSSGVRYTGLLSRRLIADNGTTRAFQLVSAAGVKQPWAEYRGDEEDIFLHHPGTPEHQLDMSVFARAEAIIGDWQKADLLLLDEIGGIEMQLDAYRSFLGRLLKSKIPCLGVIKSEQNLLHMISQVPEAQPAYRYCRELTDLLRRADHCTVIGVRDREEAAQKAANFLRNELFLKTIRRAGEDV